jgi:hypothetical protein
MNESSELEQNVDSVEETEESYDDSEQSEESGSEGESQETEETQEDQELTEKGTKLDPDPQSALHQQLANERRARIQTEEKALRILQELQRVQQPQSQTQERPLIDVSKLETKDDIVSAFAQTEQIIKAYASELSQLKQHLGQTSQQTQEDRNYSMLEREVSSVRGIPELKPGTPTYSKDLEQDIYDTYKEIAYDAQDRLLPNRPSLQSIANRMVNSYRNARKSGTSQAQTRTVEKRLGGVQSNSRKGSQDSVEGLSPTERLEREMEKMGL